MSKVLLINMGIRKIITVCQGKPFDFMPKKRGVFTEEEAKKLKASFGEEIMSVEDATRQFEEEQLSEEAPAKDATPAKPAGQKQPPVNANKPAPAKDATEDKAEDKK